MKRRSFLKLLGLSAVAPKMVIEILSKVKVSATHYGGVFIDKTGKFFAGSRKSYIMWNGKELKIKGKIDVGKID